MRRFADLFVLEALIMLHEVVEFAVEARSVDVGLEVPPGDRLVQGQQQEPE